MTIVGFLLISRWRPVGVKSTTGFIILPADSLLTTHYYLLLTTYYHSYFLSTWVLCSFSC